MSEAKRGTHLRQHGLEIGRVFLGSCPLRLILRHGAAVDPQELDPLASRRNEKGLDGLELFAVGIGLSRFHPAMGDGQNLLDMCPADHLFIADGDLHESARVLRAQLLEKGQVLAGEGAQEVGLDHPEPTRNRVVVLSQPCLVRLWDHVMHAAHHLPDALVGLADDRQHRHLGAGRHGRLTHWEVHHRPWALA